MKIIDLLKKLEETDKDIVIIGPTASGKSALADEIASHLKVPVVNFDSRQFYKNASILTCSPDDFSKNDYYLYNIIEPDFDPSLGFWVEKIREINGRKLLVGGTGFYIKALQQGVPIVSISNETKEIANNKKDPYEFLKEKFPAMINKIHKNDNYRVQRALEFALETGESFENYNNKYKHDMFIIKLDANNEILEDNIKIRTHNIFDSAIDQLIHEGYYKNLDKIIGYKECWQYIDNLSNKEETILDIIDKTIKYAKKQNKFFKTIKEDLVIKL